MPFAAPACINLENMRRLFGRAVRTTRAPGGPFRAVLGIIGRSAAEWRACIRFCSVKCMHLVPNLTKKAIPLRSGERVFFFDGKTGVFLLLLGSPASKVDVPLQSGERASVFAQ